MDAGTNGAKEGAEGPKDGAAQREEEQRRMRSLLDAWTASKANQDMLRWGAG